MSALQLQQHHPVTKPEQSVFPTTVDSLAHSQLFMNRMLAVSISSIAYLRNIFQSDSFTFRSWESCKLPILTGNTPNSREIIQYVQGILDALQKGYLREVLLGITCDSSSSENVVEAYAFKFDYSADGRPSLKIQSVNSKKEARFGGTAKTARDEVVRIIRQMTYLVNTLGTVPTGASLTFKLLYYDDITPADYEPPGFSPCKTTDFTFNGSTQPVTPLHVGSVRTKFHECRIFVRSTLTLPAAKEEQVDKENDDQSDIIAAPVRKRPRP